MSTKTLITKGVRIVVVGLGVTGRAAVRFCLSRGAEVLVSDSRSRKRLLAEAGDFLKATGVQWEADDHSYDFLAQADLVIVSPGIPEEHGVLVRLKGEGKPMVGELAVAAPYLDMADTAVVAVTGTNGKTTVTSLIGDIVRAAGKSVFVGGNIGTPIFDFLREGAKADVAVVEVSSFQLMASGEFAPDIGVLLNVTPDHLDRHGSMEAYGEAKMRLFAHQRPGQIAVLGGDDPRCAEWAEQLGARCSRFGTALGCTTRLSGTTIVSRGTGSEAHYDLAESSLNSGIGVQNAAAAILACEGLGIAPGVISEALARFRPGPHRLQPMGELAGIRFVNDSKATNTGAVIAALQQLSGKALLIAGGREKGEDYRQLRDEVAAKTRGVIVIGEAAPRIEEALTGWTEIHHAATMEEAVRCGFHLACSGDAVLLSPACASFDMFTSYSHRGEVFGEAVSRLIAEHRQGEAIDAL